MLSKIQGCLMGVMIGDAMGVPVEMMTPEAIVAATDGKGIVNFIAPIQRKIKGTQSLPPGSTSDDWQLTETITNSLIRRKEFDITDIALSHLSAYETSTFGWGSTTRDGLEEIKKYFDSKGAEGRSPLVASEPRPNRGLGNGIAMKIAPVGLLEAIQHPHSKSEKPIRLFDRTIAFDFIYLADHVASIGRLTHSDARAWSAAYAVALIIGETLLLRSITDGIELPGNKKWLLERIVKKVARFETKYRVEHDGFAERLRQLENNELLYGPIETLRKTIGTNCNSLESVCFAIAIFLRNPKNFRNGILEAVNSGGDTDSTAGIAGALIGNVVGIEGIPREWAVFNPAFQKAIVLGEQLIDNFL